MTPEMLSIHLQCDWLVCLLAASFSVANKNFVVIKPQVDMLVL